MPAESTQSRILWIITDDKPGHRNQLLGLLDRLQLLMPLQAHWVHLPPQPIGVTDWLLRRNPLPDLPAPHWVIGAGHRTHRAVLFCQRIFKARTILLMRPSLPLRWFDACIVPRHDNPPSDNPRVLATTGVLNTLQPQPHDRDSARGLMLIGGVNAHFSWDSTAVCQQVVQICQAQPQVRWLLTNSRRTPEDFLPALQQANLPNLDIVPVEQTPSGWVKQQLESAGQVWVTRDSVSMVFESITAAAPTGLLNLQPLRQSRVVRSMDDVIAQGWAQDFAHWDVQRMLPPPQQTLWEADRAARWVVQRLG